MKLVSSILLTLLLAFLSLSPVRGQNSPWSAARTFEQPGWFPGIAADSSGRVHLFWSHSLYYGAVPPDGTPSLGYDVVFYTSTSNGQTWEAVRDIIAIQQYNTGSVEVTRPNPWIAPNGVLHLTYRNQDVFYSRVMPWEASQPRAWSNSVRLNVHNLGYFSDVVQDSSGRLHAAYTENQPDENCPLCYHLFYRYSDDGGKTWSLPVDLSALEKQPLGAAKAQFFLDEQENLHIIWEAGQGGTLGGVIDPVHILHAVSFDNGLTWPLLHNLSAPEAEIARNPALAQDGHGRIVAVWMDSNANRVVYRLSVTHGRTWEAAQVIPDVLAERVIHNTRQSSYALVGDSAGHLHLVMVGIWPAENTYLSVLHLAWDGEGWSSPEIITDYPNGDVPEWPQAAISLGNHLHVTWFVRPAEHVWDANPDFYSVWYSQRRLDAPSLAPIPYPTTTIRPATTPTATPLPSPTPPPAFPVQPIDTGYTHVIFSENDDLGIIAASLLPIAVFLTLWAVYTYKKHRS